MIGLDSLNKGKSEQEQCGGDGDPVAEVLDGFRDGRGCGGGIEERGGSHREGEAAVAEPGGDDQEGAAPAALRWSSGLLQEGPQGGRCPVVLEREPGQCHPLLPYPGEETLSNWRLLSSISNLGIFSVF